MKADDLLCSRNARSRTTLVGRAQWKINQPPSLKRERASLEGASSRLLGFAPVCLVYIWVLWFVWFLWFA